MKQPVFQNVFSKSLSPSESDLLEIGGDGCATGTQPLVGACVAF